ncbi:hypothetical protein TrLO_g7213 [Triparma laevis f. longispina]|uniref:Methionine synthase reductase n=1 Tax=Triparma laevis f. longispina TaxID=1714387 RepID=A0A9W7DS18_9STRA|nr:hypothetical protein TrLO_g7213 [Triparma laevis f. longispina]
MAEQALLIIYGSATGNSEHIATQLHKKIQALQPTDSTFTPAILLDGNSCVKTNLPNWSKSPTSIILITSTTGDGDSPENISRLFRTLKRKSSAVDKICGCVNFCVLALGDTNYSKFCYTGEVLDKKFKECGGTRVMPLTKADEATGLEEQVSSFEDRAYACIKAAALGQDLSDVDVPPPAPNGDTPKITNVTAPTPLPTSTSPGVILLQKLCAASSLPDPLTFDISGEEVLGGLQSSQASSVALDIQGKGEEGGSSLNGYPLSLNDSVAESGTITSTSSHTHYTRQQPYSSPITSARYLAGKENYGKGERRVIEICMELPDDFGYEYTPGDSVGILIPNSPESVNSIESRIKGESVMIEGEEFGKDGVLRERVNFNGVLRRRELIGLSEACTDPSESTCLKYLGSKSGSAIYTKFITANSLSLVHLMEFFPSLSPGLEEVLNLFTCIPPRYYSVTTSPLQNVKGVGVAFSVVDYKMEVNGDRRLGHVTGHFEEICGMYLRPDPRFARLPIALRPKLPCPSVKIFPFPSKHFKLPADPSYPIVMVGPGTGVAPFMSFINHRKFGRKVAKHETEETCEGEWRGGFELEGEELAVGTEDAQGYRSSKEIGESHLFFGCRTRKDWIFEEEIKAFEKGGELTKAHVCFSREEGEGKYVQDLMKKEENAEKIRDLIAKKNGYLYICGDAANMARDVLLCLEEIFDGCEGGGGGKKMVEKLKFPLILFCYQLVPDN